MANNQKIFHVVPISERFEMLKNTQFNITHIIKDCMYFSEIVQQSVRILLALNTGGHNLSRLPIVNEEVESLW